MFLFAISLLAATDAAAGPYTAARQQNVITEAAPVAVEAEDGSVTYEMVETRVAADQYGNAAGNQYDLVVDGAFEGQTVAVLHFYTGEGFDFSLPRDALREKGFGVYRWANEAPPAEALAEALSQACQLWIISDDLRHLSEAHLDVIEAFFDEGHGVYVWGDNQPYYSDANAVAERLFGSGMDGNLMGNQVVTLRPDGAGVGLTRGHDVTTGLEHLYEGITIATLRPTAGMVPILYGSAGNLVAATYEQDGKRAVLDGGFTRLYVNWDTAGTARYVKNAAAWLVNYERFGDDVLARQVR